MTFQTNRLKDGITTGTACLHFPSDENKKVTFRYKESQTVTRIIVYTEVEVRNFTLQGSFENDKILFRYTSSHATRHVVYFSKTKLSSASNITFQVLEGTLTVCEIEVYGDCAPPHYYLGCTETCILTCYKHRCNYNGFCYTCRHGRHGTHCMDASGNDSVSWIEENEDQKRRKKDKENFNIYVYLVILIIGLASIIYIMLALYVREKTSHDHEQDTVSERSKKTFRVVSCSSSTMTDETELEHMDQPSDISSHTV